MICLYLLRILLTEDLLLRQPLPPSLREAPQRGPRRGPHAGKDLNHIFNLNRYLNFGGDKANKTLSPLVLPCIINVIYKRNAFTC